MDCVVNKLKSEINGNFSPYKVINVRKGSTVYFSVSFSEAITVNGYNEQEQKVFTGTNATILIGVDRDVVRVEITDKRKLVGFGGNYGGFFVDMKDLYGCSLLKDLKAGKLSSGDIYNLKYCTQLETFLFDTFNQPQQDIELYGDISVFANTPNLKTVQVYGNDKLVGDIGVFNGCSDLETLIFAGSFSGGGLTGSINSLSSLTKLSTLNLNSNVNVVGNITTLAESQKASRELSTLTIKGNGTILVDNNTLTVNNTTYTVTFDGNGGYTIS